ncbi:MAG: S8 family serine peptidase [Phaeodactylibacter sp.]|nr:S8 family serine peptidase [Phaeodactylibacter sp.]MCB9047979.1 S8 family serine peptidase [Lewinellaceae bacterium]
MKKTLLVTLVLFSLSSWQQPNGGEWKEKVDASLLEKVSTGGEAEFLILLRQQADVSGSRQLRLKEEKGQFVFEKLRAAAKESQGTVITVLEEAKANYRPFYIVNAILAKGSLALIREVAQLEAVVQVQDNPIIRMQEPIEEETEAAPVSFRNDLVEWGVGNINADDVWAMGYTGQGVVIGGQDTGYDWDHPAIRDTYRGWDGSEADHNYNWHDAIHELIGDPNDTNPCGLDNTEPCDDHSHGTHTMGTMAGSQSDDGKSIGVAPGARWIACRNMERGDGTPATYIECFEWFLAPYGLNGENPDVRYAPHVINNSWSCPTGEGCNPSNFATMEMVVDNLKAAGIVVVVSAGNDGSACSTVNTPAAMYENSFSVGATQPNDSIANFSSRGPVMVDGSGRLKPNVSAPGVGVRSSVLNGGFATYSGTSMAGPHVAGLVALLISAKPELAGQVEMIETIIEQTAVHLTSEQSCGPFSGLQVPNAVYGYGRVDALAAVLEALEVTGADERVEAQRLHVFPNPTTGQAYFQMEGLEGDAQVQAFTLSGQLVYSGRWSIANGSILQADLSALPSGIYWYRVVTDGKQFKGKLVKQ